MPMYQPSKRDLVAGFDGGGDGQILDLDTAVKDGVLGGVDGGVRRALRGHVLGGGGRARGGCAGLRAGRGDGRGGGCGDEGEGRAATEECLGELLSTGRRGNGRNPSLLPSLGNWRRQQCVQHRETPARTTCGALQRPRPTASVLAAASSADQS